MRHLSARTRLVSGLVLAGLLFAVGLTLALTSRPSSSFGWTAYSPLSSGTGVVVLGARTVAGIVIAAVGLAGGAGLVGFALAWRRATAGRHPSAVAEARR